MQQDFTRIENTKLQVIEHYLALALANGIFTIDSQGTCNT